jgi:hypothetical protein
VGLFLITGLALAQEGPAYEDVLVTDSERLEAWGHPPDATNVYERIYFKSPDPNEELAPNGGFGPERWFTTQAGRFFLGRTDADERALGQNEGVRCLSPDDQATFEQQIEIPMGAIITGWRWWAVDGLAADQVVVNIWRGCHPDFSAGDITFTNIDSDSTGIAFDGGNFSAFNSSLDETFDGGRCYYFMQVVVTECASNLNFQKVRWYWNRQVSPAPGAATFGDVPIGHPFFQFVEALSASGITAGCGGGNFCPDDPLTRGQMAVFLSAALGLYWGF